MTQPVNHMPENFLYQVTWSETAYGKTSERRSELMTSEEGAKKLADQMERRPLIKTFDLQIWRLPIGEWEKV